MIDASAALAGFREAPFAALETLVSGPFVVLAPHPDDESLGCGGLIAQAVEAGLAAHIVVLTDGAGSHPNSKCFPPDRLVALRREEVVEAAARLGVPAARVTFLEAADTRAPHEGADFDVAVERLAEQMAAVGARTLFSTWAHDPHADHVAAHRIAVAAARRTDARLLSYPVWGWMLPGDTRVTAEPAARLDVSRQLVKKRHAIAAHRSQSGLIDDDPGGFTLAADFIALHTRSWEVYVGGR
jgi:LmbE family N-acetylglucosaminyl deacetylase